MTATANIHAPGIYFGMPADEYHADHSLGSSSIRKLRIGGPAYWWDSHMNPQRPPDVDTAARRRGRAVHALVLEGEAAFDAVFARRPDDPAGATAPEKGAITKAFNAKCATDNKLSLHGDDYDRAIVTGAYIAKNPHLGRDVFSGGMPEVSVFWCEEVDGVTIQCKKRDDYLKPRGIGDLKTIANERERRLDVACVNAISDKRHDLQTAHYLKGRSLLARFVADGMVYGDHDAAWLKRVAAAKQFAFQFVFFQSAKAPLTWSCILSPQNPMIEFATMHRAEALAEYARYRKEFGDSMWIDTSEPKELMIDDMPGWYGRN